MSEVTLLLLLCISFCIFQFRGKKHPIGIILLIWNLGFLLLYFSKALHPVPFNSMTVVLLFSFLSLLVSIMFSITFSKRNFNVSVENSFIVSKMFYPIGFFLFLGLAFYLKQYFEILINKPDFISYIREVRLYNVTNKRALIQSPIFTQFKVFTTIFVLFSFNSMLTSRNVPIYRVGSLLLVIVFLLLSNVAEGARSEAVMLFLYIFFITIYSSSLRLSFMILPILFISVISTSFLFRGGYDDLFSQILSFVQYGFSGFVALSDFLNSPFPVSSTAMNKTKLCYLSIVGCQDVFINDFIRIGVDRFTNVYTGFAVYVYYFGFTGLVFFMLIILFTVEYLYTFRSSFLFVILLSIVAAGLVLFGLNEFFLSQVGLVARVLLFYFLIYWVPRKIKI